MNNSPVFGGSPLKGVTLNIPALLMTPETPVCGTGYFWLTVKSLVLTPKAPEPHAVFLHSAPPCQ